MLLASQIILIVAGILLLYDGVLMVTHRPNPIKSWPLPCPVTLFLLGIGVILMSIAVF
jgi:hypothetical protein